MRLLILSPSKSLYDSQKEGYNGVGWIASLQQYLEKEQDIELALAFVTPSPAKKAYLNPRLPTYFDYKSVKHIELHAFLSSLKQSIWNT